MTKREKIFAAMKRQGQWIADHGGNLEGYIARYGDPNEFFCLGEGGTAIFNADMKALELLERRYEEITSVRYQYWRKHERI